ncbi:uncharacterized protein LOC120081001 [Benincasa hispida]|uniref:uncharacterized protein LOC120081001 n=1 Tax=Benincasa hispida TaxID=102211 RepID=UPI0019019EFD|nr:uncharacterized protein LOC120081001 [Benincasa hispida]
MASRNLLNRTIEVLIRKYGVHHHMATPYDLQMDGQAEISNCEVKSTLEKIVGPGRKDWSFRLDDALWAYRTAYKALTGTTPFRLVYGKAYHIPVEIEHKAYWTVKKCDMELDKVDESKLLQLQELKELRLKAYESAMIYKKKTKLVHDYSLIRKDFQVS